MTGLDDPGGALLLLDAGARGLGLAGLLAAALLPLGALGLALRRLAGLPLAPLALASLSLRRLPGLPLAARLALRPLPLPRLAGRALACRALACRALACRALACRALACTGRAAACPSPGSRASRASPAAGRDGGAGLGRAGGRGARRRPAAPTGSGRGARRARAAGRAAGAARRAAGAAGCAARGTASAGTAPSSSAATSTAALSQYGRGGEQAEGQAGGGEQARADRGAGRPFGGHGWRFPDSCGNSTRAPAAGSLGARRNRPGPAVPDRGGRRGRARCRRTDRGVAGPAPRDRPSGGPPSRCDHLYSRGDLGGALLYSALFAPELAEVGGCVFLKDLGVKPSGDWEEVAAGVRAARAEAPEKLKWYVDSFNWVELPYLFADRDASDEEDRALAEVLAQAWRARLKDLFPDRRFAVRIMGPEETGHALGLGFGMVLGAAA